MLRIRRKNKMDDKMPAWDLSDFYSSITDPQIENDLEQYRVLTRDFADKYKGNLSNLSAEEFLLVLQDIENRRIL